MVETVIVSIFSFIFLILGKTAFIWGPLLSMYIAFSLWHHFVTDRFILGMKWVLFEVQVPRDQEKTPMAMELILTNSMYHASIKGLWEIWVQGAPHFWFSLEIAGIDGNVHFYVRTPSRIRDLVETQIYAQYPQSKVVEVEDYTLRVNFNAPDDEWYMWGAEFAYENHDAHPIRTYKDYGLDEPSDEEQQKIDPLTPTIEYLGSLKKGQQVWLQHIVRPSMKHYHTHGKMFAHHGWIQESKDEMERLQEPYTQYKENKAGPVGKISKEIRMPRDIEEKVKKMREKIQKLGFDVGIRLVVLSETKYVSLADFDGLRRSSRLLFRQYNNPESNSLLRRNPTQFDSPFADPTGQALHLIKNRMLNWYRLRTFFHPPLWYSFKWPFPINIFFPSHAPQISVMNVEEIATIYHFPGQVSQTPSFRRIDSRVAKPPANLPT